MIIVVVVSNIVIALILLYVAWLIRTLRRRLTRIANNLSAYERSSHAVLNQAPAKIIKSQQSIHNLQQRNQPLDIQLQRVQQVLALLGLGQQLWRRFGVIQRGQFIKQAAKYR